MSCESKRDCEHPEKKRQGEDCTPAQVEECHGDAQTHPCECSSERVRECHGEVETHPCDNA
jgi:hypothetical protein